MKKKPDRSVFVHKLWLKTRVKSAKVKHGLDDTQTSVSVSNVGRVGDHLASPSVAVQITV